MHRSWHHDIDRPARDNLPLFPPRVCFYGRPRASLAKTTRRERHSPPSYPFVLLPLQHAVELCKNVTP